MPETFTYEDAIGAPAPASPPAPQSFTYEEAMAPDAGSGRPLTIRGDQSGASWLDTAKDVGLSAATGIERGAINAATLPVSIDRLGRRAMSWAVDHVLGPPSAQAPVRPGSLHDFATNTDDYIGPEAVGQAIEGLPGSGPMYQPQTTAGRYAETVGEFLPGGTSGGVAGLVKNAVVPGLASEAVGQATQGTGLEPWARVGAAALAGGAAHLVGGPGAPAKVLAEAAGSLDAPTLDAAQRLMDAARQQGTPLTLAEAMQQVTNSGTRLGSLQRVVEQSRGGAEPMARFYADRPGQVQQAGNAAIDRVGPVPAVPLDGSIGPVRPNPSAVGPAVQQAAQGALADTSQGRAAADALAALPRTTPEQAGQVIQPALRGVYDQRLDARSAQARQDFGAAATDHIPAEHVQTVLDSIDRQIAADKTGLLASKLRDVRNRLSTRVEAGGQQWEADPLDGDPVGQAPPAAPLDAYTDRVPVPRPSVPRPQTLQDFVKSVGGIQDPRGDLKAMGLDLIPGLVAKPGKGLGPDAVRQIAAEQGYLGANVDDAMANSTVNDLFDALGNHPVHSARDTEAALAWDGHDASRAAADRFGGIGQSAAPPRAPTSAYGDIDPAAVPEPPRLPITDVANLNRARKYFRDRIALPQTAPKAIDKETAATIAPILGDLDQVMTEGSPAYARANRNFQTNSVPLEPFENTPALSSTIERDAFDKRFTTPAEQVPGLIDRGGASAARTFNDVAPTTAREVYERHLATQLLGKATGANGLVDADRLARTVQDSGDVLRQFPEVARRMQRVIDTQRATEPLRNTMVGRLAATPEFREQASIILDPSPMPGSASEVADAVRQVAQRSPEAARALVSQRVRQVFSEATQSNMSGPNQWGGAKFNAIIRGNDQQARNLKAAVEALHGPGVWRDFQQTLDVFEAMGRRQAPGSQTEFNRQLSTELQRGGIVGQAVSTGASPAAWTTKVRDIYDSWRYGRNTEVLADMLTRPDAAKRLAAIAKSPAGSAQSQGMAAMYLLGTTANQGRKGEAK